MPLIALSQMRRLIYNGHVSSPDTNSGYRSLPSVDEILRSDAVRAVAAAGGERFAADLARRALALMRSEIAAGSSPGTGKTECLRRAAELVREAALVEKIAGTNRAINATGVLIHTNLGRAPLSAAAREAVAAASGYCTLEYDVSTGKRGKRGRRAENLVKELTGAEDALIVNNCAAAAYFILTAFASGGEVVISRGEMVEIGGDFRVPDVLSQSGAKLREVGTTNRTKLADYENAITGSTKLILRVHPSNYRIVGFTSMPGLAAIADLAHRKGLLVYEDIGSGVLIDLIDRGISDEPTVRSSIEAGVDMVTFSGDKLLGGPQAGVIAGKTEYIEQLRKHPLYRALRVDKIAYAALEATLESYRREAYQEIPVLRMLSMSLDDLQGRAERLINKFQDAASGAEISDLSFEIIDGVSAIGGGAAPHVSLPTRLIAITHKNLSASRLEYSLRMAKTPIITRIFDDRVVIDPRTVAEDEEDRIVEVLKAL